MPEYEVALIIDETGETALHAALRVEHALGDPGKLARGCVMIVTDLGSGSRARVDTQQLQDEPDTEDLGQRLPDDPAAAVIAASAILPELDLRSHETSDLTKLREAALSVADAALSVITRREP